MSLQQSEKGAFPFALFYVSTRRCCRDEADAAATAMNPEVARLEVMLTSFTCSEVHGASRGPRAACDDLNKRFKCPAEWEAWASEARVEAVLGSCRGSLPSVLSGIRCYVAFIGA